MSSWNCGGEELIIASTNGTLTLVGQGSSTQVDKSFCQHIASLPVAYFGFTPLTRQQPDWHLFESWCCCVACDLLGTSSVNTQKWHFILSESKRCFMDPFHVLTNITATAHISRWALLIFLKLSGSRASRWCDLWWFSSSSHFNLPNPPWAAVLVKLLYVSG
jgi:hypothetical protein